MKRTVLLIPDSKGEYYSYEYKWYEKSGVIEIRNLETGKEYTITGKYCDCPVRSIRNKKCKHEKALPEFFSIVLSEGEKDLEQELWEEWEEELYEEMNHEKGR